MVCVITGHEGGQEEHNSYHCGHCIVNVFKPATHNTDVKKKNITHHSFLKTVSKPTGCNQNI